jgi:hypothetical protein
MRMKVKQFKWICYQAILRGKTKFCRKQKEIQVGKSAASISSRFLHYVSSLSCHTYLAIGAEQLGVAECQWIAEGDIALGA